MTQVNDTAIELERDELLLGIQRRVVDQIERTAEYRERKAEEYPGDSRNGRSAYWLQKLAEWANDMDEEDRENFYGALLPFSSGHQDMESIGFGGVRTNYDLSRFAFDSDVHLRELGSELHRLVTTMAEEEMDALRELWRDELSLQSVSLIFKWAGGALAERLATVRAGALAPSLDEVEIKETIHGLARRWCTRHPMAAPVLVKHREGSFEPLTHRFEIEALRQIGFDGISAYIVDGASAPPRKLDMLRSTLAADEDRRQMQRNRIEPPTPM